MSSQQTCLRQHGSRNSSDIIAYIGPAVMSRKFFNILALQAIQLAENTRIRVPHSSETGLRKPDPTTPTIRKRQRSDRQRTADPEDTQPFAVAVDLTQIPKTSLGFVCGREQPVADFVIPQWAAFISNQHFSITFDENYQLIIQDLGSKLGTSLKYDGLSTGMQKECKWIIGGADFLNDIGEIVVELPQQIEFQITVMPFNSKDKKFRSKVDRFLRRQGTPKQESCVPGTNEDTIKTSRPSDAVTPIPSGNSVLRYHHSTGGCAEVWRVINVSTGEQRIEKIPRKNTSFRLTTTEAELLSRVEHENIIKILGFSPDPTPIIHLEYVPGGTLFEHLDKRKYFTWAESVEIARQSTSAVAYLHDVRPKITHRDISTSNVFVQYRDQDRIHIKLADFGLSKEGSDLKTFLGTLQYTSPEIYLVLYNQTRLRYTKAVDIWSLGIVLAEITWNLPPLRRHRSEYNVSWCRDVVSHVERAAQNTRGPFTTFLQKSMLQLDPECRKSAQECHEILNCLRGPDLEVWEPDRSAELWLERGQARSGENLQHSNSQSSNESSSPLYSPPQAVQMLAGAPVSQYRANSPPSSGYENGSYNERFNNANSGGNERWSIIVAKGSS